jgi:hypothetical protein
MDAKMPSISSAFWNLVVDSSEMREKMGLGLTATTTGSLIYHVSFFLFLALLSVFLDRGLIYYSL